MRKKPQIVRLMARRPKRQGRVWSLSALLIGTAAYALVIRPRIDRWGATDEEVRGRLPGDELESTTGYRPVSTRAITIDGPPDAVWPWLVQMGSGRAGFYTHEWVERLLFITYGDGRSATRIHPEWQELRVGDEVPYSRFNTCPVTMVDRPRCLIAGEWLVLEPIDGGTRTRLIARTRGGWLRTVRSPGADPVAAAVAARMVDRSWPGRATPSLHGSRDAAGHQGASRARPDLEAARGATRRLRTMLQPPGDAALEQRLDIGVTPRSKVGRCIPTSGYSCSRARCVGTRGCHRARLRSMDPNHQDRAEQPNPGMKVGPADDGPGTILSIDELVLRPWRSSDSPEVLSHLPGPRDRPLGDDPPAIPARRRGGVHRERPSDVAAWDRRAVRDRRRRDRSSARRRDTVRAGWPSGHVRPLALTGRPGSRCRRSVPAPGGGLDVGDHGGHPPGRVHHGRQRGVVPNGGASGLPARGRAPRLGLASRRRSRRLRGLLPHPR